MPPFTPPSNRLQRAARSLAAAAVLALLIACGGGGGGGGDGGTTAAAAGPQSCTLAEHKSWLAGYMDDWYFWYQQSPRPNADAFADIDSYFRALLYTGTDPRFPADRWSGSQSTESFNRFFGDGNALGYGVSVAGLEISGDAAQPLVVRHVEPASPAAQAGVQRGDRVMAINGSSAAAVIAANDYTALTADTTGQTLTLVLRRVGGADRTVVLTAAVFALTPVTGTAVLTTPGGRRLGYLQVKDMISQALAPLDAAFTQFKAAGVAEVVLDLRYNGGGLVSTGATLASYIAGSRGTGLAYARLLYNDRRAATNNQSYAFQALAPALGLQRVFVLSGRRTCSASEQVINGLRGAGVEVVAVGEATCGKPVGFLPASACGRTYSVVNFESVNQRNEGRYFDGLAPSCDVVEDFTAPQGSIGDPLMTVAQRVADTGSCPLSAQAGAAPRGRRGVEAGERQGMLGR